MKISYGKNPKSFSAKIFNGLDQLIHIQKTTKLKIEAIIVIEIIQILYYIFLPAVRKFITKYLITNYLKTNLNQL